MARPSKGRGLLLAFEGMDQSGKTTLSSLLVKSLQERGIPVEMISFPDYSTSIGQEIRAFLDGRKDYPPEVRYMLFAANRWERRGDIEAWLDEGKVVIANRYSASGVAYGMALQLEPDWLWNLEKGLPRADLTFLVDIPPEVSFHRKADGRDTYEREIGLLQRVGEAYCRLAAQGGWVILDGRRDVESLLSEVWGVASLHLRSKGYPV